MHIVISYDNDLEKSKGVTVRINETYLLYILVSILSGEWLEDS